LCNAPAAVMLLQGLASRTSGNAAGWSRSGGGAGSAI